MKMLPGVALEAQIMGIRSMSLQCDLPCILPPTFIARGYLLCRDNVLG